MRIALIIEDDRATRRMIARLLLAEGYGVWEGFARDPISFLPAPDVIVTDVVAPPEVDAVRTWTRWLQERFGVPVVLVTGRRDVISAGAASLGVADVVAKPFDSRDLADRVGRALSLKPDLPSTLWN